MLNVIKVVLLVNDFSLDCSKNCTIGTLNAACDACTCAHHVLTGRILTEGDVPLSEVNISLAETPYNVLAQTNVSGFFYNPWCLRRSARAASDKSGVCSSYAKRYCFDANNRYDYLETGDCR